jgi:cytochrome subunit of sulfide dehydrogenase
MRFFSNLHLTTGYSQYFAPHSALNSDMNQPHGITMSIKLSDLAVAASLAFASTAFAQADAGKDALYVKSLAATCANCHGTNGVATAGSAVVSLAGLDKAYTIAQMKAFKTGTRPATVMHQLSKGYSDAQIEVLATYFAAQKK